MLFERPRNRAYHEAARLLLGGPDAGRMDVAAEMRALSPEDVVEVARRHLVPRVRSGLCFEPAGGLCFEPAGGPCFEPAGGPC
jgi:hypothetical protein